MQDEDKSKAQLVAELHELRRRLAESEKDKEERKRAEEALWESEERYRSLVEDQIELVSRFKTDGTFLYVNSGYCSYFGKSKI